MKREGLLYFVQIENGGPIKIGFTTNFEMRLATLQSWTPHTIIPILGVRASKMAEFFVHLTLKSHRIRGEWYEAHPFVLNFIDDIRRNNGVPGLPDRIPSHDWLKQRAVIHYDRLIPDVWPTTEAMLKEIGMKDLFQGWRASETAVCRIVFAARKRGRNLKTADFITIESSGPIVSLRKPYTRNPRKDRKRKPSAEDRLFIVSDLPADAA